MFYRNALLELKKWASKPKRKPLVLRGARQVGKTSIVLEFSKEFDTFLHINLENGSISNLTKSGYIDFQLLVVLIASRIV